MNDYLIKAATIVDGSGGAPYTGDLAMRDGRITEVGTKISSAARQTINVDGCIVTPAWVDIHTHYDGPATWDKAMDPSASHGVGTVVKGNCGVGFAPVAPGMRADLNIIDFEGLSLGKLAVHRDLPAGGARLLQSASGYVGCFVNGVRTRDHDRDTGERPGRLLRGY